MHATKGVRQGGILSLDLFSVYMNDVSVLLNQYGTRGSLEGNFSNHIYYAEDLYLIVLVHLECNIS